MRMIYNYYYLIFAYYCIAFILQGVFIHKGKCENNKYFSIFKNVFVAIMFSFPLYYMYIQFAIFTNNESDLGDAILSIFGLIVTFIFFIIQWIIGLVVEKRIKKSNLESQYVIEKKFNSKCFFITIGAFIVILILSIFINKLDNLKLNNDIEIDTINYLNNKYGDCGFTIEKVDESYGYNGFVQKYLIGYIVTVNCSSINKNFEVKTGKEHKSFSDTFIYNYYESFLNSEENKKKTDNLLIRINAEIDKLDTYLNRYNKVSIRKLNTSYLDNNEIFNSNVIPDDYEKIPSIDEIYKLTEHNILNYQLELIVDKETIDMKVHSIDEAKEVLETLILDTKVKYTLSGLTVYRNKEVFKKYDSEEDLMNNLIYDLVKPGSFDITSVKKIRNALINYYSEIANHIIEYYPYINSYKIKCNYGGYIIIDSQKIYISTYGSDIDTAEKIINR